ncbi:MAG: hypothetical protein LBD23_04695 [Oscillospiraceae bacterium]|jgi:hypothetical protein|nr:hypothetical protein [Oscillospiraceae bacterium]
MKKFLIIVMVFVCSISANAKFGIDPEPLFENAEGVLCLGKAGWITLIKTDSVPLTYRDTVLSDATPSRLYFLPYASLTSMDSQHHFFVYWQFPDGVRVILHKNTPSFLYPSGLQPGLHNLVSEYIKVVNDYPMGPDEEMAHIAIEYLPPPYDSARSFATDNGVLINGILWATRNIDAPYTFAASPEDAGKFYQWGIERGWATTGEVTGWYAFRSESDYWSFDNCPCPNGWRVPDGFELKKLCDKEKVSSEWTTQNGVAGRLITDIAK